MVQTENSVKIVGILSSVNIEEGSYVDKRTGKTVEDLNGTITIKTTEEINGKTVDIEIPCHVFVQKYYGSELSSQYTSVKQAMSYKTIANVGEENADRVSIIVKKGAIHMNEYYNQYGKFVRFPRININYINKLERNSVYVPQATFTCDMVIQNVAPEVDANGNNTGRLNFKGAVVQYGDIVELFDFVTENQEKSNLVEPYWTKGKMVHAKGKLNFGTKTEIVTSSNKDDDDDFGDATTTTTERTISVSELVICGGKQIPYDTDLAIPAADIEAGLRARQARIEAMKNKSEAKVVTKAAPARTGSMDDLGF